MKAIVALSALCLATAVEAGEIPKFQVDAAWPKTLSMASFSWSGNRCR